MADRYTYVPLIGVFMMVAWGVPCGLVERRIEGGCSRDGSGVADICAVLSRFQIHYWKNSETLFRHALNVTQENFWRITTWGGLGDRGKVAEAITELRAALQIKPYACRRTTTWAGVAGQGRRRGDCRV